MNENNRVTKEQFEKAKKGMSDYIATLKKENDKVTKEQFDAEVAKMFSILNKVKEKEELIMLKQKIEVLKEFKTLIDSSEFASEFSDEGHSC